ncbi:MAG TPA: heavy metal-binding domain-containing protein [Gemmata sp.]|nr:heavy metal-binding domain-containing protein [Gemmata sp.]
MVAARARFLLLVGAVLGLVAAWPLLQNVWDKLTGSAPAGGAVSGDMEYWCPMCPGVVSDWPSKCPVCSMTLVRREKDDMTPLPDGVVARIQLSPYRLQLAGVRTSLVDFRRLEHEIIVGGLLEAAGSDLTLAGDVFEPDAAALAVGSEGRAACDSADDPAPCRVVEISRAAVPAAGRRVRVKVENLRGDLRPGAYAAAKFLKPVSMLESYRRVELDRWCDETAVRTLASGPILGATDSLLAAAVRQPAARAGYTLCVPESAVIDTGSRRVVYVETMPGMFDAVEIRVGRRHGDFYPVRWGLEAGQRVATAGAVLLDAETRLNPSVATAYFGAGARGPAHPLSPARTPEGLSAEDRQLAAKQQVCPVMGGDLNAMGGPVKVIVDGRIVFVCCEGCEKPLRQKATLYLPKLPK